MKAPDEFSLGVAMCCVGSVLLVVVLYVGIMDYASGLNLLIIFSLTLHIAGLLLVAFGTIFDRWRAEQRMYYDWGLY
jgi:hypothetical protein